MLIDRYTPTSTLWSNIFESVITMSPSRQPWIHIFSTEHGWKPEYGNQNPYCVTQYRIIILLKYAKIDSHSFTNIRQWTIVSLGFIQWIKWSELCSVLPVCWKKEPVKHVNPQLLKHSETSVRSWTVIGHGGESAWSYIVHVEPLQQQNPFNLTNGRCISTRKTPPATGGPS